MSIAAHPNALSSFADYTAKPLPPRPATVRRRSTPTQGRALEILGHAVEYLADSRLYDPYEAPSDGTAIRTLMSCSRQVFAECEVVQPWHQRVQMALLRRLHVQPVSGH